MIELDDKELKQLQMIELEMLQEVARICNLHNIKYTIIGGTLLGAVRHGGFIPWDDDADVAMLRPEYEKFCNIINESLDHSRFYFQDMEHTQGYRWGYGKIRRKNTVFLREGQEEMPYEQGVFLDIFPIDGTPDSFLLRIIHEFRCFIVRKILWSSVGRKTEKNKLIRNIYKVLYLIPDNTVKKMYRGLILKKHSEDTEVVRTLTFPSHGPLHGYYRNWFAETAPIEFEGIRFEGVKDYKGWLTYEFGDYMKIPPKEKQKAHPVSEIKLIDVEIKRG